MFSVILSNDTQEKELLFKVRNTQIAKKWADEIAAGYKLYETNRLTNWGTQNIIPELNQCITDINKYDNIIDRYVDNASKNMQEDLNYLHKFFEDLRGDVDEGTDWYHNAPKEIQNTVERFNVLIHELEHELHTQKHPTVVVTFHQRPRYELTDEDKKHFTFKWRKGTVYINYCHVGKPVLDMFKDKDTVAEGIRPQTHYSADFMIKFGASVPLPVFLARKVTLNLWVKKQSWFGDLSELNLGMIPVADCVTKYTVDELKQYTEVKKVCIK